MIDDVYICTKSEAFQSCNDTERFGVESVGAADGLFENARQDVFSVGWAGIVLDARLLSRIYSLYSPAYFKRR